ncbi:hypothetical protein [Actinoplanes sp. RD1]|uniref:hypothetical protein n=1 Tax=Actinoplanes sp. RD1 TaxID=3064538 RepID=UPI00274040F2|nr:hypothetical protein [Actinoplanes sp. RD1]
MGVLEDCADFVTVMGAGKALFRHGSAAEGLPDRLIDLIGDVTVPPGTVTLFASSEDIARPQLRDYVRGEVTKGGHVAVTVFDPGQFTVVDDLALLERARDQLGVDVADLRPPSTVAQREAVASLRADASPPSQEKLTDYLSGRPDGLTDEPGWLADRSGLLGVPLSLFGAEPGYDLRVLGSPAPVTRTGLEEALGGTFARIALPQIVDEIAEGRARAVLVHGWSPGATEPELRWLIRDDDGVARWAVNAPDGILPAFTSDGAADPRTRLLEQAGTTALFLGPDGTAYAPAVVADDTFRLSVDTSGPGRTMLVGPWDEGLLTPTQRELLAEAGRTDADVVLVNVRGGRSVNGPSTLEPAQSRALHSILKNNPQMPLVLATEANDQLMWLVTQQHQRSAIQPVPDGFVRVWDVMGPDGRRDRYGALAPEILARGRSLARTAPDIVPPELRNLLASNTWEEAAGRFHEHIDSVRTQDAADLIARLIEQHDQRLLKTDRLLGGTIGASPFAEPEVALPAYRTLVTTALRAAADPALAGQPPIAPANAWITEPIGPHTRTADDRFLLGYLTDRRVPFDAEVGDYMLTLLWLREMVQAMLTAATGLAPADGIAVMKAKGELDGERAARPVMQPETLRAHAVIAETLFGTIFPAQGLGADADRQALLESIDCLTGEDRVAWLYIVKNQVRPHFPAADAQLTELVNTIVTCH